MYPNSSVVILLSTPKYVTVNRHFGEHASWLQMFEQVAEGLAWESIIEGWHNSISKEAIAEALQLASQAFLKHVREFVVKSTSAA